MSGLFLNFYQVFLNLENISIKSLLLSEFPTKESFDNLKKKYSEFYFYKLGNRIFYWSIKEQAEIENSATEDISLIDNSRIFSKIFEKSMIYYLNKLSTHEIAYSRYTHSIRITSRKDLLNGRINGLNVKRQVELSPYYFKKNDKIFLGFTLSTSLKNSFLWTKNEFINNGIDINGLKGDDKYIYANRQALKRFLETQGVEEIYESMHFQQNKREQSFKIIDDFYNWILRSKDKIEFPFSLEILSITKRYIPFEDDLIKSEIIYKPNRYFYNNRKNVKKLRFYDQMVKEYYPYSWENFKKMNIGVICPKEYQGETESFLRLLKSKLIEIFHLEEINIHLQPTQSTILSDYEDAIYKDEIQSSDIVYVIVNQMHEKLSIKESPYYYCKAKLLGNGIPTQDIQIETIRKKISMPVLSNISLNTYAKIGGTAWTIEKEDRLRDELIIGIGSTISKKGEHILGIAQIFRNDGDYIMGDCAPLSNYDNYATNLEEHLYNTLLPLVNELTQAGKFRLIFHLFKSPSEKYELKAVDALRQRFSNYEFEFALVHLGYGHNFRFYYNDGHNPLSPGLYVQLDRYTALLNFLKETDLPLKIELDHRSNFTSLFYIAKQVFWFSHLSHRSYIPAKRTVTIMYPSLMAQITEKLKEVDGWDYDRLSYIREKLWFI